MPKGTKVTVQCPCGALFQTTRKRIDDGHGKYCSRPCMYRFKTRPKGLTYNIVQQNRAWFPPGHKPWSAGKRGIHLSPATEFKPGTRPSPETEFKPGEPSWNKGTRGVMPTGDEHHAFKGEAVSYVNLHKWVRRWKPLPSCCEKCGAVKPLDWSNKSGEYRRHLDDWWALCRKCHLHYDRSTIPGAMKRRFG